MKGLATIPSKDELVAAYDVLGGHVERPVETQDLGLYSQWVRFDPRLAELLTYWVSRHWRSVNSFELNAALAAQPWPAAMAVILEQVRAFLVKRPEREAFTLWQKAVTHGCPKARFEMFFIGTMAPGGKLMRRAAEAPHRSFVKWGYLGADVFVNKASAGTAKTLVPQDQRLAVLDALFKKKLRITVTDYRQALNGGVSRRQAELDLKNAAGVRAHGNTRARTYTRRGA